MIDFITQLGVVPDEKKSPKMARVARPRHEGEVVRGNLDAAKFGAIAQLDRAQSLPASGLKTFN
jgi:hypothetical protein